MLPAQRNKVDISKLTPDEQKAFRLFGKLPSRPVAKSQERKYFDSGDWALSKAKQQQGESAPVDYGKEHPTPEVIPHATPTFDGGAMSPGSMGMGIPLGVGLNSPSIGSINSGSAPGGSPPSGLSLGGALSSTSPTGSASASGSPSLSPHGAIPIGASSGASSSSAAAANANANSSNAVNLSMSPGRVGIGGSMGQPFSLGNAASSAHALATSPTRSTGSFPIAHSHSSSSHHHSYSTSSTSPTAGGTGGSGGMSTSVGVGIPIGSNLSPGSASGSGGVSSGGIGNRGTSLSGTSPMVSATTGNQTGKVQISRRASQSESDPTSNNNNNNNNNRAQHSSYLGLGSVIPAVNAASNTGTYPIQGDSATSPPPKSSLAHSITPDSLMEDDDDDGDDGVDGVDDRKVPGQVTPGPGEDDNVEGMELQ